MIKVLKIVLGLLFIVAAVFFFGPKVEFPELETPYSELSLDLEELDSLVQVRESKVSDLKPQNEARIIWADSIRKTPWSLVYIHGFSASPMEGNPVHFEIAKQFGMNMYLARIYDHGRPSHESMKELTPQKMIDSGIEAIQIGRKLGEKVLVMSCSTGGTISIYLSAQLPDLIDAMVLYSPNIEIANPLANLVTGPWGSQLARSVEGDYRIIHENIGTEKEKYSSVHYRIEGILALQSLIDQTMVSTVFEKVNVPFFMGYYYKSETEQDNVVSVPAMLDFYSQTSTPENLKQAKAFPEAGNHVICSDLHSNSVSAVIESTSQFLNEQLGIPVDASDR